MSVSQLAHPGASVTMMGNKCHMEVGGHEFIIVECNGLYPVIQAKKARPDVSVARNVIKSDATALDIVRKQKVDSTSAAACQAIVPAEQAQVQQELQDWHQRFGPCRYKRISRK